VLTQAEDLEWQESISYRIATIKAYYEQNKAKFQIPEKRVIRYALLDSPSSARTRVVYRRRAERVYKQNIQQFQVPTSRSTPSIFC